MLDDRFTPFWQSMLTAGDGGDRSVSKTGFGDFPFETHQHQYAWQNDLTLPAGALTLALERREERVETDSGFAVRARNTNSLTGVYRIDDGRARAAGRTCVTTTRASTAAGRPARSRTAIGSCRAGA